VPLAEVVTNRRPAERGVSRTGLIGGVLLAATIVFIIVQSLLLEQVTCEVCIDYKGRSMCRTVGGASPEEARNAAITNACAYLASGVTDSMACAREVPASERCW
jgi:hypothetical protein